MEFCLGQSVRGARAAADRDFSTSIQFVQRLMDGSVPGTPRIGFAVVDVRDLADLQCWRSTRRGSTASASSARAGSSGCARSLTSCATVSARRRGRCRAGIPDFVVRLLALFDPSIRQVTGELNRPRVVSPEHTA